MVEALKTSNKSRSHRFLKVLRSKISEYSPLPPAEALMMTWCIAKEEKTARITFAMQKERALEEARQLGEDIAYGFKKKRTQECMRHGSQEKIVHHI